MTLVSKLNLKGVVESRGGTSSYLRSPGDAVVVQRETPRWLLLSCPCGCGAAVPINLDSRAGPAWRLYKDPKRGVSVFPSVWRDTDCGSHFIIWRDSILLFDRSDEDFSSPERVAEVSALSEAVHERIPATEFVSYVNVADLLDEVPWDVLDACRHLVRTGILREGIGEQRGTFSRV